MHDNNDTMTLPELRLARNQLVDQQRKIQMYKVLQALQIDIQWKIMYSIYVQDFSHAVYHEVEKFCSFCAFCMSV